MHPKTHPVSEYEFEVIIGGDGRRNTLEGTGQSLSPPAGSQPGKGHPPQAL